MKKEEKWATVDASREEAEDRLDYALTDAEWDQIVGDIYDEMKESILDHIEDMAEEMQCENAPSE